MAVKIRKLLLALLLLCLGNPTDLASARPGDSPRSQPQGQAVQGMALAPIIALQEGLLSVNVRNASWQAVLQEIERLTGIDIRIKGQLSGTLTHAFDGLTLERGLRRLLRHTNYVFFYATDTSQGTTTEILTTIWLFPQDSRTTGEQPPSLLSDPAIEQYKATGSPVKTAKEASKKEKIEPRTEQAANADEQEVELDAELNRETN